MLETPKAFRYYIILVPLLACPSSACKAHAVVAPQLCALRFAGGHDAETRRLPNSILLLAGLRIASFAGVTKLGRQDVYPKGKRPIGFFKVKVTTPQIFMPILQSKVKTKSVASGFTL